ncbi:MAG: hypothetical protein ACM3O4_01560 [Ignavibacteriales bacterium]
MKKIIFILLLFSLNSRVLASDIYYSPYSSFSDYSQTEVLESDLVKVEKKVLYSWYNTEKSMGDYYVEGSNDVNYPFIDKGDYILSDWSEWFIQEPEIIPNRLIIKKDIYEYKDMLKIRYIHIKDVEGSNGYFNIPELNIYINNQKINYDYLCTECNSSFDKYINNGITRENQSRIKNGNELIVDLKDYYNLNDFKVVMYLYDEQESVKRFKISVSREKENNDLIYAEELFSYIFKNGSTSDIEPFNYTYQDLVIKNPEYSESGISNTIPELFPTRVINPIKGYKYKDILYRHYNLINHYMDGYSEIGNDDYPYKGETITLYRSQTRDKVVIKKDLIIDNKDINLKDFILESTVNDIKITSNLDKDINGTYKVNYILPYKTITKDVMVDIKQNLIDALNYKINENQSLKKQINNLNTIINNQYINIKEILKGKDDLINKFNNDILTLQLKNKELNKNKESLSPSFVIKKSTVLNKTLLFIYLIIVLITIFVFKIKYKLKK